MSVKTSAYKFYLCTNSLTLVSIWFMSFIYKCHVVLVIHIEYLDGPPGFLVMWSITLYRKIFIFLRSMSCWNLKMKLKYLQSHCCRILFTASLGFLVVCSELWFWAFGGSACCRERVLYHSSMTYTVITLEIKERIRWIGQLMLI